MGFFGKKIEPKLDFLETLEHFIPIRYELILEAIQNDSNLDASEKERLLNMGVLFQSIFHQEYFQDLQHLKTAFVPFNPDVESVFEKDFSEEEKEKNRQVLMTGIEHLLTIGNYNSLTTDQLNECLALQPMGGLSVLVNLEKFSQFTVFYRGVRQVERPYRLFYLLKRTRSIKELKRVCVVARYKSEFGGNILVKLFKEVAVEDLKVVTPEVKLRLPIFDKVKLGGTFLASVGAAVWKILLGTLGLPLLLAGLIGYLVKIILGFLNSRTKCMQKFSQSLYSQSLSNNVGALAMLIDQAEVQEVKEALLAYMFLYLHRNDHYTMDQIDKSVEKWLLDNFKFPIDFEVDDAIRKLLEKNIGTKTLADDDELLEKYEVLPLDDALQTLHEYWNQLGVSGT